MAQWQTAKQVLYRAIVLALKKVPGVLLTSLFLYLQVTSVPANYGMK